jgi:hypothetical protein
MPFIHSLCHAFIVCSPLTSGYFPALALESLVNLVQNNETALLGASLHILCAIPPEIHRKRIGREKKGQTGDRTREF